MVKTEKKAESHQTVVLRNDTIINGEWKPKGTVLELPEELKELLQPFGYFDSKKITKKYAQKSTFTTKSE